MGFGILKDFTPWDPLIALHPKEPVPLAAGPLPGNLALRRPLFGTSKGCWFNAWPVVGPLASVFSRLTMGDIEGQNTV